MRYDGGHKRDDYLTDVLGRQVEWVPFCPEVEAGFGVPREPMRLVGSAKTSRLVTIETQRDLTKTMKSFSARRIKKLQTLNLSGYVFKARSPSCGIEKVPLYNRRGEAQPTGTGLFAKAFRKAFPKIPVTDEGRLADPAAREQFLSQAYDYQHRKRSVKPQAARSSRRRRKR